jgi:hypothetical protein
MDTESEEDARQTVEALRGYNGRMQENYTGKNTRWIRHRYSKRGRHTRQNADLSSVNLTMQLISDGSEHEGGTGALTLIGYLICCGPCIIIDQVCCPKQSN